MVDNLKLCVVESQLTFGKVWGERAAERSEVASVLISKLANV